MKYFLKNSAVSFTLIEMGFNHFSFLKQSPVLNNFSVVSCNGVSSLKGFQWIKNFKSASVLFVFT